NETLQSLIAQFLLGSGYRVTSYPALTSIEELAAIQADLFIIDERLPSVSGHIICIMLHTHPGTQSIPQILISGSPMLDRYAELAEVTASLQKPFGMAELLILVKDICG
ncbi:Response regulator receiver domain-containing protein, partial [Mucilaginibacter pineti]